MLLELVSKKRIKVEIIVVVLDFNCNLMLLIDGTVSIEISQSVGEKQGSRQISPLSFVIFDLWDRAIYNNTIQEAGAIGAFEVRIGRGI